MELIKGYLQKIARINLPDDTLKRLLVEILEQDYKIKLDRKQIKVRQNTVVLEVPPMVKSEIFINKAKILAKIKDILGAKTPIDIR